MSSEKNKRKTNQKAYRHEPLGYSRFRLVMIGLFGLVVVLVMKLSSLQVLDGVEYGYEFLQSQGERRMVRVEKMPAQRGMIVDRNGEPLAVSTSVFSLVANPKQIIQEFYLYDSEFELDESNEKQVKKYEEQKKQFEYLAKFLNKTPKELERLFEKYKKSGYLVMRKNLSPESTQSVLDQGMVGVYAEQHSRRFYPAGEVTSHLIGVTNGDDKGVEGFELGFNKNLSGKDGSKQVIKDRYGRVIRDVREIQKTESGKNLETSIDLRLQYLAYRELKAAVSKHRAKAGSVVVLDIKTGEVLAVANQPALNPNDRATIKPSLMRNRAITDAFEPGSTAKPFTMLAALESGRFTPGTYISTSPGWIKIGNKTFRDLHNKGKLTLSEVLQTSSQVGTIKTGLATPKKLLKDVFVRAGFGQATGSGFPGERSGVMSDEKEWSNIDTAAFSFGHGMTVTLLQLARAYSVFGNEGELIDVSFQKRSEPEKTKRMFKKENINDVLAMLKTVTQRGGTGRQAQVPGYSVAGKTGTAHKVGGNAYEESKYIASFVGLLPSTNPRVVVAVMIDEPSAGKHYGGDVAAPVFSGVAASAMRILNIKPDQQLHTGQVAGL